MRRPASRVLRPASLGEAPRTARKPKPLTTGFGGHQGSHRILMLSPRRLRGGMLARKPTPCLGGPRGSEAGVHGHVTVHTRGGRGAGEGRAGDGVQVPRTKRGGSDTLNTNHLYLCILRLLHLRSTPRHPLRNPLGSPTPTSSWPGGMNVLRWRPPAETCQTRARKCYHSSHLRHLQEETEKPGEGAGGVRSAALVGAGGVRSLGGRWLRF